MKIPHLWTHRDPRNHDHVMAAINLISEITPVSATMATARELAALGVPVRKKTKIIKDASKSQMIVCIFYFLDTEMTFNDNVIVTCATCRAALQIRFHAVSSMRKLCCFCAVDEALAAYWKRRD